MTETKNYFTELNKIDVSDKVEKKNGLSYLSWAYAWGELKKRHADATYTVYENAQGFNYHTDGRTAWVKTGVTVNGLEYIEYLPIMDYRNNSIPLEKITSFDVNKAIQRSLTKAISRHGLGLYIYAGEDLPETDEATPPTPTKARATSRGKATAKQAAAPVEVADPVEVAAPSDNVRQKLVDYCKAHKIDITKICKLYHLNNNSSDEDFTRALGYCNYLVKTGQEEA